MIQHSELLPTSDSNKSATECSRSENSKLPRGLIGMKGFPVAKGTRLPSLRAPRDLTLGGTVKRTFAPNVSQCKERSKNNNVITPVTKPEKTGKNKLRTREHTQKRTKTREYIQTQGTVFDGEPHCINSKGGRRAVNRSRSKSEKNTSPKSKQTKAGDEELQRLLCDDFIDDDGEEVTEKLLPTILPISNRAELQQQHFQNWNKTDQDVDGNLSDSSLSRENKCLSENSTSKLGPTPSIVFNVDDLPKSGRKLLFQFPDCLPGIKEKSENMVTTDTVSESSELPQKKKGKLKKKEGTAGSSKLADWPEGYLGKLRIHKSGKAYLAIGSLILDINISTSVGFLQELVSLKIKNNTGDMHVLGQVSEKVVCVPSAESLLASCS